MDSLDEMMRYKDYFASLHYSNEDKCFFGKVEFIKGLVTFEASDVTKLEEEFHMSIDEYIEDCIEMNVEPQKTFSGKTPLRLGRELHKKSSVYAKEHQMSLNSFFIEAIESKLKMAR